MNNLQKVHAIIEKQTSRALYIIFGCFLVTAGFVYANYGVSFSSVLFHAVSSIALIKIVSIVSIFLLQRKYFETTEDFTSAVKEYVAKKQEYENDEHVGEDLEEDGYSDTIPTNLEVVERPEKPVGTFKDQPIYEWLDIKIGGKVERAYFEGAITLKDGMNIILKNNEILFSSGLLYAIKTT